MLQRSCLVAHIAVATHTGVGGVALLRASRRCNHFREDVISICYRGILGIAQCHTAVGIFTQRKHQVNPFCHTELVCIAQTVGIIHGCGGSVIARVAAGHVPNVGVRLHCHISSFCGDRENGFQLIIGKLVAAQICCICFAGIVLAVDITKEVIVGGFVIRVNVITGFTSSKHIAVSGGLNGCGAEYRAALRADHVSASCFRTGCSGSHGFSCVSGSIYIITRVAITAFAGILRIALICTGRLYHFHGVGVVLNRDRHIIGVCSVGGVFPSVPLQASLGTGCLPD